MRVLVVRFSAMGDCVMAAWAATAIRVKYPEGVLDWAVETRCRDVIDTVSLVDHRMEFPRDAWRRTRWSPSTWRDQIAHHIRLRGNAYDLGFDLQGHSKTALCLYLAKPRRRIAAFATDAFAMRLNPLAGRMPDGIHMVEWFGQTLCRLEPFTLPIRPIMPAVSCDRLHMLTSGGGMVATIAVGAGQPGKTVPTQTWRDVGERLGAEGWKVVYVGGGEETVKEPPGTFNLVGKTTVPELSSVIASSDLLLAGDTGAGHLAAAYGTPVVTVFGSNDPRFYRPYTDRGRILKRGTGIADFTPTEILREARDLMGEKWPKGS